MSEKTQQIRNLEIELKQLRLQEVSTGSVAEQAIKETAQMKMELQVSEEAMAILEGTLAALTNEALTANMMHQKATLENWLITNKLTEQLVRAEAKAEALARTAAVDDAVASAVAAVAAAEASGDADAVAAAHQALVRAEAKAAALAETAALDDAVAADASLGAEVSETMSTVTEAQYKKMLSEEQGRVRALENLLKTLSLKLHPDEDELTPMVDNLRRSCPNIRNM